MNENVLALNNLPGQAELEAQKAKIQAKRKEIEETCEKGKRHGFSFMEILVSLVMIVSLSVGAFFMYNEAQHTRKMAQMHNDMDAIVTGLLTYESMSLDSSLPATIDLLHTGIAAEDSIDGAAHEDLVRSSHVEDGNFVDPWGAAYVYSNTERTLTCTPNDPSGTPMTAVVKHF